MNDLFVDYDLNKIDQVQDRKIYYTNNKKITMILICHLSLLFFVISGELNQIAHGLHMLAVNVNLITPDQLNKTGRQSMVGSVIHDSMGVNVSVPTDERILPSSSNSLSSIKKFLSTKSPSIAKLQNFLEKNPNIVKKLLLTQPELDVRMDKQRQLMLEPNKKFLNEAKNGKKTDVSVTVYHHQAIQDPVYERNKRKFTNIYGKGYGVAYGYDLDGKYSREKGYQFEKALGQEICRDKKSCGKVVQPTEDSPDTALKKHILSLIRHSNEVDLDSLLTKSKKSVRYRHGKLANQLLEHEPTNTQNVYLGKVASFEDPLPKPSFYYPRMIIETANISSPEVKIIPDDYERNPHPNQTTDIITLFKSKDNRILDDSRNYDPNLKLEIVSSAMAFEPTRKPLLNDAYADDVIREKWKSRQTLKPIPCKNDPNSLIRCVDEKTDLRQALSQINRQRIKLDNSNNYDSIEYPRISNNKIHNHWYIKSSSGSKYDDLWNEIDFLSSNNNNFKRTALQPNENPYSRKFPTFYPSADDEDFNLKR